MVLIQKLNPFKAPRHRYMVSGNLLQYKARPFKLDYTGSRADSYMLF
jgi:hypothetical protein